MLKTLATLALLVLAVAAQSKAWLLTQASWSTEPHPQTRLAGRHQLGVVHYDLPGRVPVGNSNTSTAVLLHLFIKVRLATAKHRVSLAWAGPSQADAS